MLTGNNGWIILQFIIIVLVSFVFSFITIKKWEARLYKIHFIAICSFLVLYFPIVEYWSIWLESWSMWPGGYMVNNGSILNEGILHQERYDLIYSILEIISNWVLFYSIPIFIFYINKFSAAPTGITRILNWIPLINIPTLSFALYKIMKGTWLNSIVILFWTVLSFLWIYYRFIALPLVLIGVDSFSFIDHSLFGDQYEREMSMYVDYNSTPIGYDYAYLIDLAHIIVPALTYLAALIHVILLVRLRKIEMANIKQSVVSAA